MFDPVAPESDSPARSVAGGAAALFAVLLGGLLAACAPASAGLSAVPPSNLRILHTTSVLGYLEPCGCVAGRFGGLDRLAAYIEEARSEHPATLFIDSGDLFCEHLELAPNLAAQLPTKADAMLRIWGEVGCDALGVGDFDMVLGPDRLREIAERNGVPLVNANLLDLDGEHLFEPYRIVERGGIKVGVFSLLGPRLRDPQVEKELKDTPLIFVEEFLATMGVVVADPVESAREVLTELRPRVDLVVLAAHLGRKRTLRLLDQVEGIDLVLGSHVDDAPSPTEVVSGVPHLMQHIRGARASRIDLWWDEPQQLAGGVSRDWSDLSAIVGYDLKRDVLLDDLALLKGREPLMGSAEFENELSLTANELIAHDRALPVVSDMPAGLRFSHLQVPMYAGIGRSESALVALDDYHDNLHEFWALSNPTARHPNADYVGAATCAECHPQQYEFWKATRHSRAYSTLEVTRQHFDAECVGCHTVGYGDEFGFTNPAAAQGFENVQCAACHGPGGRHLAGGDSLLAHLPDPTSRCDECHNKVHHPEFPTERASMLLRVACPPMGKRETWSPRLTSSLRSAAMAAETASPPNHAGASVAYQKLGDFPAALDTAKAWLRSQPASVQARLNLADCLIDTGGHVEAAEILSRVVRRPGPQGSENEQAWGLYVDALLVADPEAAIVAAREAYSLAPTDPRNAMRLAEACLVVGRRLEAVETLRTHLEMRPVDLPILKPRLDEISGLGSD